MRKLVFQYVCASMYHHQKQHMHAEYFILKGGINTCSKSHDKLDTSVLASILYTI